METKIEKERKREPTVWHYVGGKKIGKATFPPPSGNKTPAAIWRQAHPGVQVLEILDMRAVMK